MYWINNKSYILILILLAYTVIGYNKKFFILMLLCCGSISQSAGVFWLNAAETWIDVASNSDENVVSSIVNFVSGSAKEPQVRYQHHHFGT